LSVKPLLVFSDLDTRVAKIRQTNVHVLICKRLAACYLDSLEGFKTAMVDFLH